ncbi:MAG: hypothetical protein O3A95_08745 [Planctomycetota bacterium]|nr:hypothetical protein [Planctomycetota bacterium]MDA1114368.1 hypothetical protein [Planctomycetota bacterium]
MLICLLSLLLFQQPAPVEVIEVAEPPIEAPAEAQEPGKEISAPVPEVLVELPPDTSKEAAALMAKVAADQFPTGKGKLVDGLNMKVEAEEHGEHPHVISFTVIYTKFGAEQLELIIEDPERGGTVAKGFDGRDYWLREGLREGEGKAQILSGHEFTKDREAVDDAMNLCSDLLLLVDIHGLERRQPPEALSVLESGARVLSGSLRRHSSQLWDYSLVIPANSLEPSALEVRHWTPAEVDADGVETKAAVLLYQRFEMSFYKRFDGRNVPQAIDVFHSLDSELPDQSIILDRFHWSSH